MNGILAEHEARVNQVLSKILSSAFLGFFFLLIFLFNISILQSSVLLMGAVAVLGVGKIAHTPYGHTAKYLNLAILAVLLTALMTVLGENNIGIPVAVTLSLTAVAMYYNQRLVVFYVALTILLNSASAGLDVTPYLINYVPRNWITLTALFLLGAVLAWNLAKTAAGLIGFAEQQKQESKRLTADLVVIRDKISSLVERTAAIGEELSCSTAHTANTTNRLAASVGDMTATTGRFDSLAGQILSSSNHVHTLGEDGQKQMFMTREAVDEALDFSRDSLQVVNELETASHQITGIIDLIANIAGQTGLLALNAAIEAARA
ncbi:MAG: hypothetical protein GX316_09450, partial [Firmicutes bacterium]|nr:hypothetical protein [Bacillota bacterium]